MNPVNPVPQTMVTTHHVPPAGRQARPRRKSLEQLEAKYKALMRNMLMYQQMRKRNMYGGPAAGTGTGTAANIKTEPGATGLVDEKSQQQHLMFQARQTLPTPSSSVSPSSSTTNLEDASNSTQIQGQQQPTPQHHQVSTSTLREHQRDRPQKRLQNASNGPKSAYDRRENGSSTRHSRAGRPMPAAIQLAYDELASMQRQQTPQPPQPQQHQQHQQPQFQQQQPSTQQPAQQSQQPHQGSAPIPIPRPANIQIPPHYLQQQPYMHLHAHHQPLASPLPTPPHLTTPYTAHHNVQTIPAPYASYDTSGMQSHMDQQQQQHHPHHPHQQQQHGLSQYEHNGNVEGDLLDCFVSNMNEI
ncbi:hypothetical protein F5Y08DRAFT_76048 [Xylaria arbuscula]|nr:hypothetical protein F5Y08DRAFT_76048 [Xylaria arbuscula]